MDLAKERKRRETYVGGFVKASKQLIEGLYKQQSRASGWDLSEMNNISE